MPKVTFKVHKAGFQPETEDLTRLVDKEVELSELNAKRFLLDPHQETLWDTCRFSETKLPFDEWLTKCGNWNNETKMFQVTRTPSR
ncbi:MAG: hypothetical protein ABSF82_11760 [Candidatus Bathyarchaeia archaeon]|jgi:hypothetical protein